MKKLAVPNYVGLLVILSFALIFVSSPAQAYVYDDFTASGYTSLWQDVGPDYGLFSQPGNGNLYFLDNSGGQIDSLASLSAVTGPFAVAMQYLNCSATNNTTPSPGSQFVGSSVDLWIGTLGATYTHVSIYEFLNATQQGIWAVINNSGSKTHIGSYVSNTATTGWLGIVYNGMQGAAGVVTLYYDVGSGWTKFASYNPDFPAGPIYFAIEGYDPDGSYLSFQVDQVDVVPLPPSAFFLVSGLIPLAWAHRRKR